MRAFLLAAFALTLVVVACGDYSNEDIAFLDALPGAAALTVRVPTTPSTALSDDAPLHRLTVGTAEGVNQALGGILSLLDLIRTLPPAHRTPNSRSWGPFDDHGHPGFEIQVTLTRDVGIYDFQFEERRKFEGGAFVPIITGTFFTQSAQHGHGTLHFSPASQSEIGIDGGDPNLSHLDVVYANDTDPRTVTTIIAGTDSSHGTPVSTTYRFREQADTSGKLTFDLNADFVGDGGVEDLHLVSEWRSDGAGRSDGEISGTALNMVFGDGGSDRVAECWDAQFTETYFDSAFYSGSGDGGPLPLLGLECDAASGHPTGCPSGDAGACVLAPAWP